MGIGDELMMAGEARRRAASGEGKRFLMLDKRGDPKWHFVWEGNPHIARPGDPYDGVIGYRNGKRPYIESITPTQYTFRRFDPLPADIEITVGSKALAPLAAGAIVFNPTVKQRAPVNKDWGLARWKALLARGVGYRWLQIGEPGVPVLRGAEYIATRHFWDACGVMQGARAVICHEGALHHAAAALGVPTIVIRGGFISPKVTGYAGQVDLYVENERHPLGCGMRTPCGHCADAMAAITPERVLRELKVLLGERVAA